MPVEIDIDIRVRRNSTTNLSHVPTAPTIRITRHNSNNNNNNNNNKNNNSCNHYSYTTRLNGGYSGHSGQIGQIGQSTHNNQSIYGSTTATARNFHESFAASPLSTTTTAAYAALQRNDNRRRMPLLRSTGVQAAASLCDMCCWKSAARGNCHRSSWDWYRR